MAEPMIFLFPTDSFKIHCSMKQWKLKWPEHRVHLSSLFICFVLKSINAVFLMHLVCYTVYLQVVMLLISVCVLMNMHCFPQLCHICYSIRRGGFRGLLPLFSSTLKCLSIETQVRVAPVRSSVYAGVRAVFARILFVCTYPEIRELRHEAC